MARASSACRTTNTTAHSGRRLAQGCSACSSTSSPRASVAPAASGYAYGSHRRSAQRWRRRKRYAHRHATPSFRSNISALSRACAAMYCLCAGPVARLKLLIEHPSVGMAPAASGYAYGSLRRSAPEAVEAQEEEEDGWADEARVRRERRRDGRWRDEQRIFLGFAAPRSRRANGHHPRHPRPRRANAVAARAVAARAVAARTVAAVPRPRRPRPSC